MKTCAFCNEKVKMTLDYCSYCGSRLVLSKATESRANHLEHYLKTLRNEDTYNHTLEEHGFDINNWVLPFWIEFGEETNSKATLKGLLKESYILLIGFALLSVGFVVVDKPGLIIGSLWGVVALLTRHKNTFVEALKFENPLNKAEHYILYNLNNTLGGVGKEEFIHSDGDFNEIRFYYDGDELVALNFGQTNRTIVKVDKYSDIKLLERFILLYAYKYNITLSFINDAAVVKKLKTLNFDRLAEVIN
jgi:hypothetical protein